MAKSRTKKNIKAKAGFTNHCPGFYSSVGADFHSTESYSVIRLTLSNERLRFKLSTELL